VAGGGGGGGGGATLDDVVGAVTAGVVTPDAVDPLAGGLEVLSAPAEAAIAPNVDPPGAGEVHPARTAAIAIVSGISPQPRLRPLRRLRRKPGVGADFETRRPAVSPAALPASPIGHPQLVASQCAGQGGALA
jgi:hypothetical protein